MSEPELGQCAFCEQTGAVVVNGTWACMNHLDDVFSGIARSVMIIEGVPDETIDRMEGTLAKVLHQLMDDTGAGDQVITVTHDSEGLVVVDERIVEADDD